MIKHVILWKLRDDIKEDKNEVKKGIKDGLESLKGQIEGLIDISVRIECLGTSTADVMLDSTFENEEALKRYANHEKHLKVANNKVRPYTATRACMDYEI